MTDSITLHNTLSRKKERFVPLDPTHIKMYVCGPTVYDIPHIGNARAMVVYDQLYRTLRAIYPYLTISYVRNLTDVDDKIIMAAKTRHITIDEVTKMMTDIFHDDMAALNCLEPTVEPRATDHIAQMVDIIERLITNGHAYVANHHVYFSVESDANYGELSGRHIDDMVAGARIEVEDAKKHPGDFVLWKPADEEDDASAIFPSPWGDGRPGWHIECSAMSSNYLGNDFDIHGGGADLMFPHHTNEIAQSCCAFPGSQFARYWVHNGFVTVEGEKMSKSIGNVLTVQDMVKKDGIQGETIRTALLLTHYRKPLNWTDKLLSDTKKFLDHLYRAAEHHTGDEEVSPDPAMMAALADDLNTPLALTKLHEMSKEILKMTDKEDRARMANCLVASGKILGVLWYEAEAWFHSHTDREQQSDPEIEALVLQRTEAKKNRDFAEADRIRTELQSRGIILEDTANGTSWHYQK